MTIEEKILAEIENRKSKYHDYSPVHPEMHEVAAIITKHLQALSEEEAAKTLESTACIFGDVQIAARAVLALIRRV